MWMYILEKKQNYYGTFVPIFIPYELSSWMELKIKIHFRQHIIRTNAISDVQWANSMIQTIPQMWNYICTLSVYLNFTNFLTKFPFFYFVFYYLFRMLLQIQTCSLKALAMLSDPWLCLQIMIYHMRIYELFSYRNPSWHTLRRVKRTHTQLNLYAGFYLCVCMCKQKCPCFFRFFTNVNFQHLMTWIRRSRVQSEQKKKF